MNKQDLLYDIFLKEKTLSSKQITCLGFARIYITMLEKENKNVWCCAENPVR